MQPSMTRPYLSAVACPIASNVEVVAYFLRHSGMIVPTTCLVGRSSSYLRSFPCTTTSTPSTSRCAALPRTWSCYRSSLTRQACASRIHERHMVKGSRIKNNGPVHIYGSVILPECASYENTNMSFHIILKFAPRPQFRFLIIGTFHFQIIGSELMDGCYYFQAL
jgi:hypothetical protein